MLDTLDLTGPWACLIEPLQGALEAAKRIGPVGYSAARRSYPVMSDGTAVLSVSGVLTKRDSWFSPASYSQLRSELGQMKTDNRVARVLVHVDSGGGQTMGLFDLVSDLQAAGKPTWAYIEDVGASAAFAIACACDRIYANRSAVIGSIGTFAVLQDSSKAAKNLGIKVHVIRAGAHKGVGVPGAEITSEHLEDMQRIVNQLNEQFLDVVMRGRRMSSGRVETIATGQVWIGEEAARLGLIDGVRSLDSVFREFSAVGSPAGQTGIRAEATPYDPGPLTETDQAELFEAAMRLNETKGMSRFAAAAKAQRKYPEWHEAYTRRHNPATV